MGLVDFRRQGRIGLITLNNPSKLNVVGVGMMEDLSAAVDLGLQDADVRVLLLTGSGSAFCAGANLDGGLRNPSDDGSDQLARYMKGTLNPTLAKLACAPKPVVVAVNGAAVGAGVGLALIIRIHRLFGTLQEPEIVDKLGRS